MNTECIIFCSLSWLFFCLMLVNLSVFLNNAKWMWCSVFTDLLPKPVSSGQALSGPQDTVLRRGALPLLRTHSERQQRLPPCRLLFQGTRDVHLHTNTCTDSVCVCVYAAFWHNMQFFGYFLVNFSHFCLLCCVLSCRRSTVSRSIMCPAS